MADYRIEKDTLGDVRVPANALYGAQTQRAIDNFPISGLRFPRRFIEALGLVKCAAADVNGQLGLLEASLASAIEQAAREVAAGHHDQEFPIDVFQTGSGTSTNMNANEVIATLAGKRLGRRVHPNDHVNLGQSSNDVFPTAIHLAASLEAHENLLPALEHLESTIDAKRKQIGAVAKTGRTHLMDAMPVTFDQEMGGWAAQLAKGRKRIRAALGSARELAVGGTAVGTGINTPPEFGNRVAALLADWTGLPFIEAKNHFEAQSSADTAVELSGQLKTLAVSLMKIANDLRWMNSGPIAGLGEIRLPALTMAMLWGEGFVGLARKLNRAMDRLVLAMNEPNYATRIEKVTALADQAKARRLENQSVKGIPVPMLDPARQARMLENELIAQWWLTGEKLVKAAEEASLRSKMVQVVMALAIHRAEKGSFPEKLEEILNPIPLDTFSGEPISYEPTEEGFLLRSVGPDGKSAAGAKNEDWADDIVFRVGGGE